MMFSTRISSLARLTGLALALSSLQAYGFDNTANDNVAVYWGQDSYGAAGGAESGWQQPIDYYCQDDSIDAFPIAFLDEFFGPGGLPSLDLANTCSSSSDPVFAGSELPNCQFLSSAIETCQAAGKIVTISLGGATGAASFTSESQASAFADQIWDLFLGGSSSTRPFGAAVLDGVDLDIEGGSTTYFNTFVTELRSHMDGASKQYYITGAPQCPFPDAYLGSVINAVGFDALYVQFYNNYCGLNNYADVNDWNFATWDNWAKTVSPNPNIKIYIGAPASSTAAGSGYVPISQLTPIIQQTKATYSSFGGVMLWDASQAYNNDRYDAAVKSAVTGGSGAPPPSSAPPTTTTAPPPTSTLPTSTVPPPTTTAPASGGGCAGVSAWVDNVAYVGGDQVIYDGDLWTAKWWSYGDTPGGKRAAGDWTNDGACTDAAHVAGSSVKADFASKSAPLEAPVKTPDSAAPKRRNSRVFRV